MVKITLKTKMDIHIKNVIAYKIQILSPHYMVTFTDQRSGVIQLEVDRHLVC